MSVGLPDTERSLFVVIVGSREERNAILFG
jgi:hypothetical protein